MNLDSSAIHFIHENQSKQNRDDNRTLKTRVSCVSIKDQIKIDTNGYFASMVVLITLFKTLFYTLMRVPALICTIITTTHTLHDYIVMTLF